MSDFQWYRGTAWVDVPDQAQIKPRSRIALQWPKASDRDGLGQPCGAVGNPDIVIEYEALEAQGLAFWESHFATSTAVSAALSVTAPNERTGTWQRFAGYLGRPEHDGKPSWTNGVAIFRRVRVTILNCTATT